MEHLSFWLMKYEYISDYSKHLTQWKHYFIMFLIITFLFSFYQVSSVLLLMMSWRNTAKQKHSQAMALWHYFMVWGSSASSGLDIYSLFSTKRLHAMLCCITPWWCYKKFQLLFQTCKCEHYDISWSGNNYEACFQDANQVISYTKKTGYWNYFLSIVYVGFDELIKPKEIRTNPQAWMVECHLNWINIFDL